MIVELLSILIFSFALALFVLGGITWWIERAQKRVLGVLMMLCGLGIAVGYALLGSRFAILWFGHLIITVDLPALMTRAVVYTIGVLSGIGLAMMVFMWISGKLIRPTRLERQLGRFLVIVLGVALLISLLAIYVSHS